MFSQLGRIDAIYLLKKEFDDPWSKEGVREEQPYQLQVSWEGSQFGPPIALLWIK